MQEQTSNTTESSTPDEQSGVLVQAKFKIFDPETQEVLVEGRS